MRVDQDLGLRGVGRTELQCLGLCCRDDRTADRSDVLRGVDSRSLRTALFERRPQRVDDRCFESGRRQAMDGRDDAIAGLYGRGRDVIAIANATLDRVSGRQSLASLIKELATEKRCGLQPGDASDTLLLKARLNFLERPGIDDGRMLPWPGSSVVVDLAEIVPVAQNVGERTI